MFKVNWLYSFFLPVLLLQINASPKHLVPLQSINLKISQRDHNLSMAMLLAQSRQLRSEVQIEKDKKLLQKAKRYIWKNKFKNAYNILKGKKFNKLKKSINRLKNIKQNKQKTRKKRQLLKLIDSEIHKFRNLSTNSLEVQSQPALEEAVQQAPVEQSGQFQVPRLTENRTGRQNNLPYQGLPQEIKHAIGIYKIPDILKEDGFANTLNIAMSNSNVRQKFITQIISYVFGKEIEEEKALYLSNAFSQEPDLDIAADAMVEFLIYFLQDLNSISWERIPISIKDKLLKNIYQVDSRIILFMRDFLGKLQGQIIQNRIAERTVLTKKELQKVKPYIKTTLIGLDSWKEYQRIVSMALLADAIEKTGSLGSVNRKLVILEYMHRAIPGLRATNNPLQLLFRKVAELYYHKTKSLYINADYARHKGYFGSNSQVKIIEPLVQDVIDCYFLRECEDGKSSQHALAVSQTSSSHFSAISGDIGIAPRANKHFMSHKQDISNHPLNVSKTVNKWFFDSFFRYLGISIPLGNELAQYIDLLQQRLGNVYYKILISPGLVPYIKDAHVINYSWGSELKANDFESLYSFTKNINHILHIQRNSLKPLELWRYIHGRAVNEIQPHLNKAIHVLAAGNHSTNLSIGSNSKGITASLQSAILATNPSIETIILVGASGYEDQETFASFSNYPGSEELIQKRFLTAPGSDVLVPYLDTEQQKVVTAYKSGTSFSAPMVTGAAALLVEAYGKNLLRRYTSLYNDEIFAKTLNENPANDFVFVSEREKSPGQPSIEDYDKVLALVFKKLTKVLTVDEQRQLDHITAPNLIKDVSVSETNLQDFQQMRSRFIVACLLDGARKVDLFTGRPLDPSYFGQGVLDIKSSLKLLESKFELIDNLLSYRPQPINIQEYKTLLNRLFQRIAPWMEATYNLQ